MFNSGTIYLIIAAGLIFGAGMFAAKRILRQLTGKQVILIVLVTGVALVALWDFLSWTSKKRDKVELMPDISQPTPLLQPNPD